MNWDRILHALSNPLTWTGLGSFVAGLLLAELRGYVAHRLKLRRWRLDAEATLEREREGYESLTRALVNEAVVQDYSYIGRLVAANRAEQARLFPEKRTLYGKIRASPDRDPGAA